MNFTNAPGFKTLYYLALMIVYVALMIGLVRSAIASLKRTGGKWTSVIDEVVIGIIVTAGFIIFAKQQPSTVMTWLSKPLKFVWDLVLKLLRFVKIPV